MNLGIERGGDHGNALPMVDYRCAQILKGDRTYLDDMSNLLEYE